MTSTAPAAPARSLAPFTIILVVAVLGWAATIARAQDMHGMSGTMELSFGAFALMWTLMMVAMMLPGVAPVASLYTRTIKSNRVARTAGLVAGYLAVWASFAVPAFGLARVADRSLAGHSPATEVLAAAIFVACGVYQLTPLKDRCLRHCRSPLGLLLHYGNYKGSLRDVRVGLHHGAYCAGCCVGLMALLVAFGLMNVLAMAGLVSVVLAEKYWRHGVVLSRAVGVAAVIAAVAVFWVPGLAPGLRHSMTMM